MSHPLSDSPLSKSRNYQAAISQDNSIPYAPPLPLQAQVTQVVEQYFCALDGELPTHLYDTILQEVEKPLLEVVLARTGGNQSKTAKILGLSRITLRKKMARYHLR